jgi:hypothetical protein
MGVIVDRTPKCHCEMAGEGVEHSWGCAKDAHRAKPIGEKRGKETYKNTVRSCLSKHRTSEEIFSAGKGLHVCGCTYLAHWRKKKELL